MVDRVTYSPSRIPVPIKSPSRSVNGRCLPFIDQDDRSRVKEDYVQTNSENGMLEKLDIETTENKLKKPGKEAGFETFVMTGDMIIQTSRKQELVKNSVAASKIPSPSKDMLCDSQKILEPKPSVSQEFDRALVSEFKSDGLANVDQRSAESGFVEDQALMSDSGTMERKQSKTRDQSSVSDLSEVSSEEIIDMIESQISNTSNLSGEMVQSQLSALSSLSSDTSKSQVSAISNLSDISLSSDLKSDTSEQTIFRQDIEQSGPSTTVNAENYYNVSLYDDRETSSLPWDINRNPDNYTQVDSPCMSDTGEITFEDKESQRNPKKLATSKSSEKIVLGTTHNGHPVVRPSKSHENYLQAGTDFALVNIDIEDNMTFSLDQIPQHADSSSSSLEKMVEDSPQLSRSLQNSPERRSDRSADRVFMPGFISLEEPRIIRAKCKDIQQQKADTCENNSAETNIVSELSEQYRCHELSVLDENNSPERGHNTTDSSHTFGATINLPSDRSAALDMAVGRGSELPSQLFDIDYDADSLYHQPNKTVDRPSAQRLAKRLYSLSGFRKSDVCRHLCKKNEFSSMVAEEYLKLFDFASDSLDSALRKFLIQFSLIGETQERERVLAHFSQRYITCNPGSFNSEDACHTLTCAIMLLNTDLHGQNLGRKMTCVEFVDNLAELNDGDNFPKEVLKAIYSAIKSEPIEWAVDDDIEEGDSQLEDKSPAPPKQNYVGSNPFLDLPDPSKAKEYKKGYVMRKCCFDPDGKRTLFGKRSWKMYYAVLSDMIIYLYKDEHAVKKKGLVEASHNIIRIHHALASKATDYKKKQHVMRLHTADAAECLFQTSDSKELQDWIDTINFIAATLSAPPLPGAVGSQRRFQRPLLPASHTNLPLREQMQYNEERVNHLEMDLHEHRIYPPEKGAKARIIQDFLEKGTYLENELKRYKTYVYLLQSKMAAHPEYEPSLVETAIGEVEESSTGSDVQTSDLGLSRPLHRSLSDRGPVPDPVLMHGLAVQVDSLTGEYINTDTYVTYL
ncbi:hypothetical protein ScPMuIL_003907 [Solemya velum]